ncbi:MAG: outer membrane beta-barrel protein [Acidobacteria bacterium]|nr:outer membrane beta-barrel protein [Acidobacteriota bacterium]
MKRTLIPLMVLGLIASAIPAYGQVELIPRFTWLDTDTHEEIEGSSDRNDVRLELEDDTGYGVAVNFYLGSRFSTEIGLSLIEPDVITTETNDQSGTFINTTDVEVIPVTAVLQYHFNPDGPFDLYIGGGVAYVLVDDVEGDNVDQAGFDRIAIDEDAGFAANIGLNYWFGNTFGLNIDAKYVPLESSANVIFGSGTTTDEININPLLLSGGISIRF